MNLFGLVFMLFLELGTISGGVQQYTPVETPKEIPPLYAEFGIRGDAGIFFAEGKIVTDFQFRGADRYTPTQETYVVGFGVDMGALTIGYEHSCFHPITPYATTMLSRYQVVPHFEGAYDRAYIRITSGGDK